MLALEREKGLEPSTLCLGSRCSTTELLPLAPRTLLKQAARASSTSAWPRRIDGSTAGKRLVQPPPWLHQNASSGLAGLPAESWKSIDTLLRRIRLLD